MPLKILRPTQNVMKFLLLSFALLSTAESRAEVFVIAAGSDVSIDPKAKPLKYAANDAQTFAGTMSKVGAVAQSRILLNKNVKLAEFEKSLAEIASKIKSSSDQSLSKFIFFFSGHADERGLHFKDGYYSKNSLDRFLSQLSAKTKVLIIDSCFAGLLATKGIKSTPGFAAPKMNFDEPSGSIFLTASSSSEYAFESRQFKGGLFSNNVIEGLNGKADTNHDGVVTATELYEFAFRETQLNSRLLPMPNVQKPEFVSNLSGRGAVVLSFPATSRGNVQLTPDLKGTLKLYAVRGMNTFDHVKSYGAADTISLPTGEYRIEIVDGSAKGVSDITVASNTTSLLTQHDIAWNNPRFAIQDYQTRGITSSIQETPKAKTFDKLEVSLGQAGAHFFTASTALVRKQNQYLELPRLTLEYMKNKNPRSSRQTGINPHSGTGLSIGLGLSLLRGFDDSIHLRLLASGGGRVVQAKMQEFPINYEEDQPENEENTYFLGTYRGEIELSFFSGRIFATLGRDYLAHPSMLERETVIVRLGSNIPL